MIAGPSKTAVVSWLSSEFKERPIFSKTLVTKGGYFPLPRKFTSLLNPHQWPLAKVPGPEAGIPSEVKGILLCCELIQSPEFSGGEAEVQGMAAHTRVQAWAVSLSSVPRI